MDEYVSSHGRIYERHGEKIREKGTDEVYDAREAEAAFKSNGIKLERIKDLPARDKAWVEQVNQQYK